MQWTSLKAMRGNDCNVLATFDKQLRVVNGAHRNLASGRLSGPRIARYCCYSVLAAVTILAVSPIGAAATEEQSASSSQVHLACAAPNRSFAVSGSWQDVKVNGTDKNFTGYCSLDLAFTPENADAFLAHSNRLPSMLVKLHELQLQPASSECLYGNLTLFLYSLQNGTRNEDVCYAKAVKALYIWVSEPIKLLLYVWNSTNIRASFSVAFVAVRPVDVCHNSTIPSEMVRVDSDLYVFASEPKFLRFLSNSTACSGSKQLLLKTASPLTELNVTVMSAPTNSSCWSLWLDNFRISGTETRNFVFGANVTLRYELNDSARDCSGGSGSDIQQGFTLKIVAVAAATVWSTVVTNSLADATTSITAIESTLTIIPGDTELKGTSEATAIGSAVAAVLFVTGVVLAVALPIVRRRRTRRPHASNYHVTTSVLGLSDAHAARQVSNSNGPYSETQHPALFSTSTIATAPTIGADNADIVMADNDLYGTAFGSQLLGKSNFSEAKCN